MVQSPKIRHSKQQREPVTIDLDADAVKREETQATAADATGDAMAEPVTDTVVEPTPEQTTVADDPNAEAAASAEASEAIEADRSADADVKTEMASDGRSETDRPFTPSPPPPARGGTGRSLAAGLAGGALVLLAGVGLNYAGLIPGASNGAAGDDAAIRQEIAQLRQQVESLSSAPPAAAGPEGLPEELAAVTQRLQAAEQAIQSLQSSLANGGGGEAPALAALQERLQQVEQRMGEIGQAAADPAAVAAVGERVTRIEGEVSSIMQSLSAAQGASTENARRLGELEQRLAALTQSMQEDNGDQRLARIVAATALKAAIDRGGAFRTELGAFAAVAPAETDLSALQPYADTGLPTRAALISEVPAAASAMVAAANPVSPDAGIVDRLMASAMGLVSVRPVGPVEGSDAAAIVARMEAAVNVGDYTRALAEYDSLPEPARQAGEAFAADLRARHAAEQVVDAAMTAAVQSQ
jgi:hypothetical protein